MQQHLYSISKSVLFVPIEEPRSESSYIKTLRDQYPNLQRLSCMAYADMFSLPQHISDPNGEYVVFLPWTSENDDWSVLLAKWHTVKEELEAKLEDGHVHVLLYAPIYEQLQLRE